MRNYDIVLTCGPMVMMRGVAKLCADAGVPCLASLEKKMACGLEVPAWAAPATRNRPGHGLQGRPGL